MGAGERLETRSGPKICPLWTDNDVDVDDDNKNSSSSGAK